MTYGVVAVEQKITMISKVNMACCCFYYRSDFFHLNWMSVRLCSLVLVILSVGEYIAFMLFRLL
jgi:hypothetical protein